MMPQLWYKICFLVIYDRFSPFLEMTRVKTLTRVIDFLFEFSLSPAKNAKRLESDLDESLTRPNTRAYVRLIFVVTAETGPR
jgi:hypothetical protein